MKKLMISLVFILSITMAFSQSPKKQEDKLNVPYVQYQLKNGLDVILHTDKSDPIVAVAIQYHVGSNREVPGKTGFAHLFEHMMFQQSENVAQDQFFKYIQGAGGTLNGGTGNDGTVYYEVVPKNALEMVLWMESDRMGYLENTVTKAAFANQQNVVQNEKRQSYDNQPYGFNQWLISKNLYPKGHPYSWTVIGEMSDLFNATVDDVKAFHRKFYVPNNTTLVIAGDFDVEKVKPLVEKYFGEIPAGEKVTDMKPWHVTLGETKKLYHEDNFATTPLLTMVWPAAEEYSKDAYALSFLAQALGSGKKSPFYRVIVKDKKLAPRAGVYHMAMELTGQFMVSINANAGVSLSTVENSVFESLKLFEKEGITEKDLEKFKAGLETEFYQGISSVLRKSFQLASYNEYAGSPGFIGQDIANIKAVTIPDIMRVYEKYIKNKPYLATSFVPKGQVSLVAANSVNAGIVEENIASATEVDQSALSGEETIVKTKTILDRSVKPGFGPDPAITVPKVWSAKASNGMKILGIKTNEIPVVQFSITIDGGTVAVPLDKAGLADFTASMLMEGTADKTPEELEEAIELLGASINIMARTESITLTANCLVRNFEKTLALAEEILLKPRWDNEQFELVKLKMLNAIKRNQGNPNYLAAVAFNKLVYGENNIMSVPSGGTQESVSKITKDDLKQYYSKIFSPSSASFNIVGKIDKKTVLNSIKHLSDNWKPFNVVLPKLEQPALPEKSAIYFVDVPGAKQSVIYIGNYSIPRLSPDFYAATVMNYKLGGSFNGILNLILREEKGFTYGARSQFSGGKNYGSFVASSQVRSNSTLESVEIFKNEMEKYTKGISDEDLKFTKDALVKSNALNFETNLALLNMLESISQYNLPFDYVKKQEEVVKNMTSESFRDIAGKYLKTNNMYYIVVGDAKTQLAGLEKAGLGKPVLFKPF